MARKRMISQSIFQDPKVGRLSQQQRLVFIGLITLADDYGSFPAEPHIIRAHAFGFDDVAVSDLSSDLRQLHDVGLILLYDHEGQHYGYLSAWNKWQNIHNPQKYGQCPPPPHLARPPNNSEDFRIFPNSSDQSSLDQSSLDQFRSGQSAREQPPLPLGPTALAETDDSTPSQERWTLSEDDSGLFLRRDIREAYSRITGNSTTKSDRDLIELLQSECPFSSQAVVSLMEIIVARAGPQQLRSFAYFRKALDELVKRCTDAEIGAVRSSTGASLEKRREMVVRAVRGEISAWSRKERPNQQTG